MARDLFHVVFQVVYFSSIFPYVLLTIMLIRGVTLPNAAEGIQYYLNPDFERLADAKVYNQLLYMND